MPHVVRQSDPSESDLTYEDALIEARLRRFFHSELDGMEAPEGVLDRVLLAIDKQQEQQKAPPHAPYALPGLLSVARRAFTGVAMARILPAGVAVMLVLAFLGPSVRQVLGGGGVDRGREAPAGTTPAPWYTGKSAQI